MTCCTFALGTFQRYIRTICITFVACLAVTIVVKLRFDHADAGNALSFLPSRAEVQQNGGTTGTAASQAVALLMAELIIIPITVALGVFRRYWRVVNPCVYGRRRDKIPQADFEGSILQGQDFVPSGLTTQFYAILWLMSVFRA